MPAIAIPDLYIQQPYGSYTADNHATWRNLYNRLLPRWEQYANERFQAGIQSFGYALFFMSDSALSYLRRSEGWEIGTGPSVVIVDQGMARQLSTTTLKDDVYAVVFDQKGLMAGMGIQGSKITQITPR